MLHTHLANRPEALVAALAALQRVDPLPLLKEKLAAFMLAEARAHGVTLSDTGFFALWDMDIDLNAQGLLIWAQG